MYKLTEKEYDIRKRVTPKALKGLKELGLYASELTSEMEIGVIMDLFVDAEKFKKLVDLIFITDGGIDYDNISLEELMKGYQSFFVQLTSNFVKSTP